MASVTIIILLQLLVIVKSYPKCVDVYINRNNVDPGTIPICEIDCNGNGDDCAQIFGDYRTENDVFLYERSVYCDGGRYKREYLCGQAAIAPHLLPEPQLAPIVLPTPFRRKADEAFAHVQRMIREGRLGLRFANQNNVMGGAMHCFVMAGNEHLSQEQFYNEVYRTVQGGINYSKGRRKLGDTKGAADRIYLVGEISTGYGAYGSFDKGKFNKVIGQLVTFWDETNGYDDIYTVVQVVWDQLFARASEKKYQKKKKIKKEDIESIYIPEQKYLLAKAKVEQMIRDGVIGAKLKNARKMLGIYKKKWLQFKKDKGINANAEYKNVFRYDEYQGDYDNYGAHQENSDYLVYQEALANVALAEEELELAKQIVEKGNRKKQSYIPKRKRKKNHMYRLRNYN